MKKAHVVIGLAAVVMMCLGADHGGAFVAKMGFPGGKVRMDHDQAGVLHIAWVNGGVRYARSLDGGATWQDYGIVPGSSDVYEWWVSVSGDSEGNGHIVYSSGLQRLYYNKFDGTSWTGKETAYTGHLPIVPGITVDTSGQVFVSMKVEAAGEGWTISCVRRNPQTGQWSGKEVLSQIGVYEPGAAFMDADDQGRVACVWQSGRPAIPRSRVFENGAWSGIRSLPGRGGAGDPFVAFGQDGKMVATWAEYTNTGSGWIIDGIFMSHYTTSWSPAVRVSPNSDLQGDVWPCTTIDENGITWISWTEGKFSAAHCWLAAYSESDGWLYRQTLPYNVAQWSSVIDGKGDRIYVVWDSAEGLYFDSFNVGAWPGQRIHGDIDIDGWCDGEDLIRLSIAFGTQNGHPKWDAGADLDNNGTIDGNDLAVIGANFGMSN
ncbi:hypothetical protein JW905_12900 [bacterium]|nr:hypothetical protein [candidate division CSSED10-310 bacterium]